MAAAEAYSITFTFGYLSDINPAGEKRKINGSKISALTIAVRTISSEPSYALKIVFCKIILCPKSVMALSKTIKMYGVKPEILNKFFIYASFLILF